MSQGACRTQRNRWALRLLLVGVAIVLIGPATPATADPNGEGERSADYIAISTVDHGLNEYWGPICSPWDDCPILIPSGIISSSCDDESWLESGQFQGIGGVLFCNIPPTAKFGITIHDEIIDPVTASVTCLTEDGEWTWHTEMDLIEGAGGFDLQQDCPQTPAQHPHDADGTTRVGVFLHGPPNGLGASTGTVTLDFL